VKRWENGGASMHHQGSSAYAEIPLRVARHGNGRHVYLVSFHFEAAPVSE
jgi:hypothetical protein